MAMKTEMKKKSGNMFCMAPKGAVLGTTTASGNMKKTTGRNTFRNTLRRIALITVFVIVLSSALSGCGGGGSRGQTAQFRVGMECDYAPFNWTQPDDSNGAVAIGDGSFAGGFDVAIAKIIADGLGQELVIVKTDWDGLPPALTSDKIDAIIAGMSPTEERKETIDFSDNYYISDLVIVVRGDSEYAQAKSLQDFSGAKITAQLSTFHYTVIEQIPGVDMQTAMNDFPTMITALSSGRIDGYVSERPGAISAQVSNPALSYVGFESGKGFEYDDEDAAIAVGLRKGSDLTNRINEILAGVTEADRQRLMEEAIRVQPVVD
ncbi:MAG: transporter substrate-binding domain-containing protein [Oscillospiraceae bacterium]|nr:transporter substrate-binding domain-containing protein [Oscillospiraceae bacterium]